MSMCIKSEIEERIDKNSSSNRVEPPPFLDRDEIEEMLGAYYDFQSLSDQQWSALDNKIKAMCINRGVSPDYSEEYARICDTCCEKLGFPTYTR